MADHGYAVAGYDKDSGKVGALQAEAERRAVYGAKDLAEFIRLLRSPR